MNGSMDDAIGELWAMFAPTARARVDLLEGYLDGVSAATTTPDDRVQAASAAHKLAGSLGSYLRPGSEEAALLEELLRGDEPVDPAAVRPLVAALRDAVGAS